MTTSSNAAAATPGRFPIHFFTIVLNGQPFIRHHIEVFRQLSVPWHWHIIEGVAELKHDTAWSVQNGGKVTDSVHKNGLSIDGTSEYLDQLKAEFPDRVSIYRKGEGRFWDGKLEMINQPLGAIREHSLLFQVDSDELWTVEQLHRIYDLFEKNPQRTAAYFFCRYFVGENLVTTTRDTYGNNSAYEWLRVWRFLPGWRWQSHEPPKLCAQASNGSWVDLAALNPFRHAETEALGLVFDHYAYVTEEQLRFKESYYGYRDAVAKWRRLQENKLFPVLLRDYFEWVSDGTQVSTAESERVVPLARKDASGTWAFENHDGDTPRNAPSQISASKKRETILFIRTDLIGDNVLAMSLVTPLRAKYPDAQIVVVCQELAAGLYQACPLVDRVIAFDKNRAIADQPYLQGILNELQSLKATLALNSVYSPNLLTHALTLGSGAEQKIGFYGELSNLTAAERDKLSAFYTKIVHSPGDFRSEIIHHRDFLAALGIEAEPKLEIWSKSEDERFADAFFADQGLDPKRTVALYAGYDPNPHPLVRAYFDYGTAMKPLCEREQLAVVALGSQRDAEINQKALDQLSGRTLNFCGKTTLAQAIAILRRCRMGVGAETGLAHIAAAAGVPNVQLLGGGYFGRFMPCSPLTSVACLPLTCFRCIWYCKFERHHCVRDLDARVLAAAVEATYREPSDKPRVFFQKSAHFDGANIPEWKHPAGFFGIEEVHLLPVEISPAPVEPVAAASENPATVEPPAEPPTATIAAPEPASPAETTEEQVEPITVVAEPEEELILAGTILKERVDDSPGLLLATGDPERRVSSALNQGRYVAIAMCAGEDQAVQWMSSPGCLGVLIEDPTRAAALARRFPAKVIEPFAGSTLFADEHLLEMLLSRERAGEAAIDLTAFADPAAGGRAELLLEAALIGECVTLLAAPWFGASSETARKVHQLAARFQRGLRSSYAPFDHYAFEHIGDRVMIDGRPGPAVYAGLGERLLCTKRFVLTSSAATRAAFRALAAGTGVIALADLPESARFKSFFGDAVITVDPVAAQIAREATAGRGADESVVRAALRTVMPRAVLGRLEERCRRLFQDLEVPWKGVFFSTSTPARSTVVWSGGDWSLRPDNERSVEALPADVRRAFLDQQLMLARMSGNDTAQLRLERDLAALSSEQPGPQGRTARWDLALEGT